MDRAPRLNGPLGERYAATVAEADPVWLSFRDALGSAAPDDEDSRRALVDGLGRAQAAWPEFHLDAGRWGAFIAGLVGTDAAELAKLHFVDLALVFACLDGDDAAREAFRIEYGPVVRSGLERLESSEDAAADLEQTIWERVLVGTSDRPPKLADYAGTGPLIHWLRVVLVRMRTDVVRRRARRPSGVDREPGELADQIDDPEFAYLKSHYRDLMKTAFAEAFEELEPRQRTALRLHLLDGLSTEQIGRVHGVHAATARRWLAKARSQLLEDTRARIAARGGIEASEFDSVLRLVRSRLDLSLSKLLRSRRAE